MKAEDDCTQEIIDAIDDCIDKHNKAYEPYRPEFYRKHNLRLYQVLMRPDFYRRNWLSFLSPAAFTVLAFEAPTTMWIVSTCLVWVFVLVMMAILYRWTEFDIFTFEQMKLAWGNDKAKDKINS